MSFFQSKPKKRKQGPRVVYKNTEKTRSRRASAGSARGNAATDYDGLSHQEKLDAILDKIGQSGYESLSREEKDFLFNASRK